MPTTQTVSTTPFNMHTLLGEVEIALQDFTYEKFRCESPGWGDLYIINSSFSEKHLQRLTPIFKKYHLTWSIGPIYNSEDEKDKYRVRLHAHPSATID